MKIKRKMLLKITQGSRYHMQFNFQIARIFALI